MAKKLHYNVSRENEVEFYIMKAVVKPNSIKIQNLGKLFGIFKTFLLPSESWEERRPHFLLNLIFQLLEYKSKFLQIAYIANCRKST